MKEKAQFCAYCGAPQGVFAHIVSLDGPVVCESYDCNREAREDERDRYNEARMDAEEDNYSRYGGGW